MDQGETIECLSQHQAEQKQFYSKGTQTQPIKFDSYVPPVIGGEDDSKYDYEDDFKYDSKVDSKDDPKNGSEDFIFICVAPECNDRVINSLSKSQVHGRLSHQFISKEDFKNKYEEKLKEKIDKHEKEINDCLQRMKEMVMTLIKNALDAFQKDFEKYCNYLQMRSSMFIDKEFNDLCRYWQEKDLQKLKEKGNRITEIFQKGMNTNMHDQHERPEKKFLSSLKESLDQNGQLLRNIIYSLQKLQHDTPDEYRFSSSHHHFGAQLISSIRIRSNDTSYKTILIEPSLIKNNKIQKFGFKWTHGNGIARFGICDKDLTLQRSYEWTSTIRSGTYIVSNNGYAYIHGDEKNNDKRVSFEFEKDVPIYCYYDGNDSLTFVKNSKLQDSGTQLSQSTNGFVQFQLKTQNQLTLNPCVVLNHKDLEVDLIPQYLIPDR